MWNGKKKKKKKKKSVRNKFWLECVKLGQWKGYLECVKFEMCKVYRGDVCP